MRLFHFTGSEHIEGIKRFGILDGGVPILHPLTWEPLGLANGWQWLTDDPSWQQGWATSVSLHCDRTEYRFTVVILKTARKRLVRWSDIAERFGYDPVLYAEFDRQGGGGAAHWWLFHGAIPAGWLRGIDARPALALVR